MDPTGIIGIILGVGSFAYAIISSRKTDEKLEKILTQLVNQKITSANEVNQSPALSSTGDIPDKRQLQHDKDETIRAAGELLQQIAISEGALGAMPGVFMAARQKAKQAQCMSHLKQLALATMMYVQDHSEHFPKASSWSDDLSLYFAGDSRILSCPADDSPYGYAMNSNLSNINLSVIQERHLTVLFFDSTTKTLNANDTGQSLPQPERHLNANVFAFADGHVESLTAEQAKKIKWTAE